MLRLRTYARTATVFSLGALCMTLTACGTYHSQVTGGFSDAALSAQTSGIPVQVDGSVGAVRGKPLATAVAAAMPTTVEGKPAQYAPCEPNTECAGDHLVWTFGPPTARPASAYPPALSTNLNWYGDYRPSLNNVTAELALFHGGTVVASTSGQATAAGPDDPAFRAMVANMSGQVLSGPDIFDRVGFP